MGCCSGCYFGSGAGRNYEPIRRGTNQILTINRPLKTFSKDAPNRAKSIDCKTLIVQIRKDSIKVCFSNALQHELTNFRDNVKVDFLSIPSFGNFINVMLC